MYYYKIFGNKEICIETYNELDLSKDYNDLIYSLFVNTDAINSNNYYNLGNIDKIIEISSGEYFDYLENKTELELIDYYQELERKEKEAKRQEKIYGVTTIADSGKRYWIDNDSKIKYKTTFNQNNATRFDLEQAIKIVQRKNKEKTGRFWRVQNLKNNQFIELN